MATIVDRLTTNRPAGGEYQKALYHFHRGEWEQAIRILEALSRRDPQDTAVAQSLEEARFKAHLDATTKIRAKRWIIPWRPILVPLGFVATLLLLVWIGSLVIRVGITPLLAQSAERRAQAQLLREGNAYFAAGEWEQAVDRFQRLLAMVPGHEEAENAIVVIAEERKLRALYDMALAAEESGNLEQALQEYISLQTRRANYQDVSQRIVRLRRWQEIDLLLDEASTLTGMWLYSLAIQRYEQARSLDLNYRSREVVARLIDLYIKEAVQIIEANPAQPHRMPEVIDYLDRALSLDTRNNTALQERRLARLYLEAKDYSTQGNFHFALSRYQTISDERPNYLNGAIVDLLYDAYIGSGDQYKAAGDCTLAYGQYSKAVQLQVTDTAVAVARMSQVTACLTPTPTPSNTPLPTEPPPPSATPTATATPRPLLQFRGKIAFKSDNPDSPGMWVMDANGSSREYLGPVESYSAQVAALREAETYSPDRTLRVYVTDLDGRAQIFMDYSNHPQFKSIGNRELTRMTGIAYDPVWSPDGSSIAYVTQENESDDIWLMNADGSRQRALVRNDWEWDKHPSWSPDSTLIVFWSNRNGLKHIYIMDTNGKVLRNLSNSSWDEYDPLWIK